MVVPLLIGAALNTFCPDALKIGSFTTALFSSAGTATVVGLQIFFVGTNLRLNQVGEALKRGSVLLLAKYAAGVVLGLAVGAIFGKAGGSGRFRLGYYQLGHGRKRIAVSLAHERVR